MSRVLCVSDRKCVAKCRMRDDDDYDGWGRRGGRVWQGDTQRSGEDHQVPKPKLGGQREVLGDGKACDATKREGCGLA